MKDATPITDEQLLTLVEEALRSLGDARIQIDRLSMEATLAGLGVDSMNAIEMAAYLEDKLGIRMPDDQLAQVSSVSGLARIIRAQLERAA
jgi:acyl carrier protein